MASGVETWEEAPCQGGGRYYYGTRGGLHSGQGQEKKRKPKLMCMPVMTFPEGRDGRKETIP